MATAAVVEHWLSSLVGHHDTRPSLDQEIMEYICSVLQDPDPESSLDLLVSVLAECVPLFAAYDSEGQAALVLKLLDAAEPSDATSASCAADCDGDSSVQAMVAALRQAKLQCQEPPDACCADITNTRTTNKHTSTNQQLGELLQLCPAGISTQFLQHCLVHQFHEDLQAAANWLLEAGPTELLHQQQAWEQEEQQFEEQRQQMELQQKRQKKLIVDKFDLQVVSDSSNAAAKKGPRAGPDLLPTCCPKKAMQQESRVRYRDGKVVSTKGEKIIVEKVGEEWDGGSKGKVYTKGKRGKGFH